MDRLARMPLNSARIEAARSPPEYHIQFIHFLQLWAQIDAAMPRILCASVIDYCGDRSALDRKAHSCSNGWTEKLSNYLTSLCAWSWSLLRACVSERTDGAVDSVKKRSLGVCMYVIVLSIIRILLDFLYRSSSLSALLLVLALSFVSLSLSSHLICICSLYLPIPNTSSFYSIAMVTIFFRVCNEYC